MNSIWIMYIISVLLSWSAGRYMASMFVHRKTGIKPGVSFIIVPFIPAANIILMAMAVADIILTRPDCFDKWVLKFYCVKEKPIETPETEVEKHALS